MHISEFQDLMRRTYLERDSARGRDAVFRWLTEEIGEVARAMRHEDRLALEHEVGDVLAWLTSLANVLGVDVEAAAGRFSDGCPKCGSIPCACSL
ncbi:MAG TPA: MazG nucleotide pyrophosphohydrolase domain-containing protein [Actinomycetota bacterium]|nr:MazG nucleotide pyrophosphohydrolase domain-containing protein [Actinomycetota bacterium]